jgi:hypothetical protein
MNKNDSQNNSSYVYFSGSEETVIRTDESLKKKITKKQKFRFTNRNEI